MHVVMLEAYPPPDDPESEWVGGAYVTVFVRDGGPSEAEDAARALVSEAGWSVAEVRESYEVARNTYAPDDDHLAYFEQAQLDGTVAVFHQWPSDAPDHWEA